MAPAHRIQPCGEAHCTPISSDIAAMFQSLVNDVPLDWQMLVKDVPEELQHDLDYIIDLIDWDTNTDPAFRLHHQLRPRPVCPLDGMRADGLVDYWVVYGGSLFASKSTTILPGRTVLMKDPGPYSLIAIQGSGTLGKWKIESPALIRFRELTHDEYFVSDIAAKAGLIVTNPNPSDPLVLLKTFGPGTRTD